MRTVKLYSHQLSLNALSQFQDLTPRAVKKIYIFKQLKCYKRGSWGLITPKLGFKGQSHLLLVTN